MINTDLAPVALFVYNRLDHALQTINSLSSNILADRSDLYIFSDGPKNDYDLINVNEVRSAIRKVSGFKNVYVCEQTENIGLANSIVGGVTKLCQSFGRVIVLEDDIVTSKYFLKYMNDSLNFYSDFPEVGHISGYKYPVKNFTDDSTFFLRVPMCWGWATWERSWFRFHRNISIMNEFDDNKIFHFNFNNSHNYWAQIELNKTGVISTWFVFWYGINFLDGKLTLFPNHSLVQNIGIDGSGTNTAGYSSEFKVNLYQLPISVNSIPIVEKSATYNAHCQYFNNLHFGLIKRIKNKLITIYFLWIKKCIRYLNF